MKPYRGTRLRAIRVPDEVWQAALDRAQADGSSVSAEVVAFLRAYGSGERYALDPPTCPICTGPLGETSSCPCCDQWNAGIDTNGKPRRAGYHAKEKP